MKVSKKDQDPRQIDADREGIAEILAKKCQHFEPGTWIMMNNRRGLVLEELTSIRGTKALCIEWEDGRLGYIKPHALNRR